MTKAHSKYYGRDYSFGSPDSVCTDVSCSVCRVFPADDPGDYRTLLHSEGEVDYAALEADRKALESGLCINCYEDPAEEGDAYCENCNEKLAIEEMYGW